MRANYLLVKELSAGKSIAHKSCQTRRRCFLAAVFVTGRPDRPITVTFNFPLPANHVTLAALWQFGHARQVRRS